MDAWVFLHLPSLGAVSFVRCGEDINHLPKSCPGRVAICKAEEYRRKQLQERLKVGTRCVPSILSLPGTADGVQPQHCPACPVCLLDSSRDREAMTPWFLLPTVSTVPERAFGRGIWPLSVQVRHTRFTEENRWGQGE